MSASMIAVALWLAVSVGAAVALIAFGINGYGL